VAEAAELRLLALALTVEPAIRIGVTLMGVIAAFLAAEVHLGIAPPPEAVMHPAAESSSWRPSLDHRAIDTEVLVTDQALLLGLGEHCLKSLVTISPSSNRSRL
jgi:hypothetical protein